MPSNASNNGPNLDGPKLAKSTLARADDALRATDELLRDSYPGDQGAFQPVHTVYVPGQTFDPGLPSRWGSSALDLVEQNGGMQALCSSLGLSDELTAQVASRVVAKLQSNPIEDLRMDFEDGYGDRGDAVEDHDAAAAAHQIADAIEGDGCPQKIGIRFKCFEEATRWRGIRTLDIFLANLLSRTGQVPECLVLTFPKVSTVEQVEALVEICGELEEIHQLPKASITFEIQVETPQLILGSDGRAAIAPALHAGAGRVTSLHYGTFDYSASLQIAAAYQASDHPAADHAKNVMQLAVAGTGVHFSDGSTNIVPTGSSEAIHRAWVIHAGLVNRALKRGIYQGWDMHPGHLPTRYIATFAFYRENFASSAQRVSDYVSRHSGAVMDEPATIRALARYLSRGFSCGAITADELSNASGLEPERLALLSRDRSDTEGLRAPL